MHRKALSPGSSVVEPAYLFERTGAFPVSALKGENLKLLFYGKLNLPKMIRNAFLS